MGVNCFILITGWFGVRNSLKGFLKIFVETCIWGLISYGVLVIICNVDFSIKHLIKSMDFRNNWFVTSYLMLLLVAPIIEKSLFNITYSNLKSWIILLTLFNFIFVLLLNKLNNNGYNVVQFIYLYYIARFLRLGYTKKWCLFLRKYSIFLYVGLAVLLTVVFIALYKFYRVPMSIVWFGYNNPIIILLSIAFFMFFAQMKIQLNIINLVSKGVFGIFVLHTTKYIIPVRNQFAHLVYNGIILMSLMIFLICSAMTFPGLYITKRISEKLYKFASTVLYKMYL